MKFRLAGLLVVILSLISSDGQVSKPQLRAVSRDTNGWFKLQIESPEDAVYRVEASSTLHHWNSVAVLMPGDVYSEPTLPFVDIAAAEEQRKYYRIHARTAGPTDDWKNQIYYPEDRFLSERVTFGEPETRWIKFAIAENEPERVYFQDSSKYKFHYDFAVARLSPFEGMTPAEFDNVSLRTNNQQVVLGTVLFSPEAGMREAAIQFVGLDGYRPEQIARWFRIVRAAIVPHEDLQVVYIPTYEQSGVAEANRSFFEGQGIRVASLNEWDTGENTYSPGWAIGTLKYFPQSAVAAAYANGELRPNDILLTDAVPAELPHLAGILTLSPATPNSHVAILARSHGVPFVYLADPALRTLAESLVGKEIVLTAQQGFEGAVIRLLDVSGTDPEVRGELADLKKPAPIDISGKERLGAYTRSTDELTPADIKYFGGKASNFGFLRRQIPGNSPAAIAISFDLWDEFMDQVIGTQKLRDIIADRLEKHSYPPDMAALQADLVFIRDLIEDSTQFTGAQQAAIAESLLASFEPETKIRFRSSTNVEDSESFTGAGLYDSYSGCLADDLDGDSSGPSICDSNHSKERGVFRAIRKIYASFYNDNAVLERMRHAVDESKVGMAILVHYSTPDEIEWANGVATVEFNKQSTFRSYKVRMVTQKGAVSVTNPDNSAVPEVVEIEKFFSTAYPTTRQWSSLMPLGANVLNWDKEYLQFAGFFEKVAEAFEEYHPEKRNYTLDFEYKKIAPGVLSVKQVREIPRVPEDARTAAYLLNNPKEWQVFQGEYADVFANHRLKSEFHFSTRDLMVSTNNLASTIFGEVTAKYRLDGAERVLQGAITEFPEFEHGFTETHYSAIGVYDAWVETNGTVYTLFTHLQDTVRAVEVPVLVLDEMRVELQAEYDTPQLTVDYMGKPVFTSEERVLLMPPTQTNEHSIFVTREIAAGSVQIRIEFFWPKPLDFAAGYTAPLQKWHETRIEGLTTEPIVLRGYYSQTYRPEHHNFAETFLFEPGLEPGIPQEVLNELAAADIQQILVYWGGMDDANRVSLIGSDQTIRPVK